MNDETVLRLRELHQFRRTLNKGINQLEADLLHVDSMDLSGNGGQVVRMAVYDLFVDKCKALIDEPA